MKRLTIAMGLMLIASAFTACSKDDAAMSQNPAEVREGEMQDITIQADYVSYNADSRTTFDPTTNKTSWTKDDVLILFYKQTSGTTWTKVELTTTEENAPLGIFGGSLNIEYNKAYDWYFVNKTSASSNFINPVGNDDNLTVMAFGNMTCDVAKNTEHLNDADMLVGAVLDSKTPPAAVTMHRLSVMHKFTIVNKEDAPLNIKSVKMEFDSQLLNSEFNIDFATGVLSKPYSPSNSVTLKVSGETNLAKDASIDLYLLTGPFKLGVDKSCTITVENTIGQFSQKKITTTKELDFATNTINSVTFNYTKYVPQDITGDWASQATNTFNQGAFFTGTTKETQIVFTEALLNGLLWIPAYTKYDEATYPGIGTLLGGSGQLAMNNHKSATFTTTKYKSPVASVIVYGYGRTTVSVKVGDVDYVCKEVTNPASSFVSGSSPKDLTFQPAAGTDPVTGTIVVTYTNNSTPTDNGDGTSNNATALALKKLTINAAVQ